ncbi:hypothetical protein PIROE2DRAFT_41183, partial [Piromyces sp. E2]
GIDLDGFDNDGKTALTIACEKGDEKLGIKLIEHGANINQPNKYGDTPIIIASKNFNEKLFLYLIEHGAEVNITDKCGNTPLIIECQNTYRFTIIETLIKYGADPNIKNIYGSTALIELCKGTYENIDNFLFNNGEQIYKQDSNGYFGSLICWDKRNERMIRYLVEHGADIDACDNDGNTTIKIAENTNKKNIVNYFMKIQREKKKKEKKKPKWNFFFINIKKKLS